jgi:hypothetical protein
VLKGAFFLYEEEAEDLPCLGHDRRFSILVPLPSISHGNY